MSAHLVLWATVNVGEQYTVQHSIRIRTMAYSVQTLEVVMGIPLSESATRHLRYIAVNTGMIEANYM